MIENQDIRPAQVIGPLGEPLTIDDLPSPKTKRWVVRRKAEVVAAVEFGREEVAVVQVLKLAVGLAPRVANPAVQLAKLPL